MKKSKSLSNWIGKVVVIFCLILGMSAGYIQRVYANHYSSWVIIWVSGVKEKRILYNGFKPLIQMYQDVRYRRTYTDDAGRTSYQYKTEQRSLGLRSPYAS